MPNEAEVPPKSEWKVWRVNVRAIDVQYLDVLAPNAEAAKARTQRYLDDGDNDCQDLHLFPDNPGFFEVGQDPPEEISDRTVEECPPDVEWNAEKD